MLEETLEFASNKYIHKKLFHVHKIFLSDNPTAFCR